MPTIVYCDESCHLEHDLSVVMGLGAIWLPRERVRPLTNQLRKIKDRWNARGELKWTKVSPSRIGFYEDVVNWFFDSEEVHFRALLVPDKRKLDHATFNKGGHDEFYYKMYFSLLNKILSPTSQHEIYLDIKDTRGGSKVDHLHKILCNDRYDFTRQMVAKVQQVRSHELELMQLGDLFLGALVHSQRGIVTSSAKSQVISTIEQRMGRSLAQSTPLGSKKINIFVWQASS